MKKPVYLFAGPLGSGKTTLINHFLSFMAPEVALIENEFGDINIDQEILAPDEELIIELNNGCLCCSVRTDLIKGLRELLNRASEFNAVLIESTGMADPGPVKQAFLVDPVLRGNFELKSVITIVDAVNFLKIYNADVEVDDEYRKTFISQIVFADMFYFSKQDKLGEGLNSSMEKIREILTELNSQAGIIERAPNKSEDILEYKSFMSDDIAPDLHAHSHSHSKVSSISISFSGILLPSLLEMFLSTLFMRYRENLYRGKGILNFETQPKKVIFQSVYDSYDFDLGSSWPSSADLPVDKRENQFVFIGKDLNLELIEKGLKQCLKSSLEGPPY